MIWGKLRIFIYAFNDNIMRRTTICFFLFFLFCLTLSAQPILDKPLDVRFDGIVLTEALDVLAKQNGVDFIYSPEIIPEKTVQIAEADMSLRELLDLMFYGTDVGYKIIAGQVVLFKKAEAVQKFTISGYVEDGSSGELLVGANVVVRRQPIGTSANAYGFFSLELPAGTHELVFSYSGYKTFFKKIDLRQNRSVKIKMDASLTLKEVVVTASELKTLEGNHNITHISSGDLNNMTSIGGERDLYRHLSMLPGVTTGADGIGGIHVRGGSIDQNLFLLDDVTIYNPVHMIGVFSIFNEDAIKSVDFMKGGFPAKYGGRLSSVTDIRTKDGNLYDWQTSIGLGLSTLRVMAEGPLVKGKSAVLFSARTTPLRWLVRPISRNYKAANNKEGETILSFYDINAKWHYRFSDKDKIYFSFYKGGDRYGDVNEVYYQTMSEEGQLNNRDRSDDDIRWGNQAGAFRWNHDFGDKLFMNTSLSYSRYGFTAQSTGVHVDTLLSTNSIFSLAQQQQFRSEIEDVNVKTDLEWHWSPSSQINFGGMSSLYYFTPGVSSQTGIVSFDSDVLELDRRFFDTIDNETVKAKDYALYLSHDLKWRRFQLTTGLRWSGMKTANRFYHAFLPRVNLAYRPFSFLQINGNYTLSQQYLHLLTTSGAGLPTDVWIPSTDDLAPERATQYNLGVDVQLGEHWAFGAEAYYKKMDNLIAYSENASFNFINSENYKSNVATGEGTAKGIELEWQYRSDKWQAALHYTLAKADRTFATINNGNAYPYRYDRRHDLKLLGTYTINDHWNVSASFLYGSGLAISLPVGRYNYNQPGSFQQPVEVLIYDARNSFRLPANHRLDISFLWKKTMKNTVQSINFGIYNVYSRKNALYYRLGRNPDNPSEPAFLQATLMPILPFVDYKIGF